MKFLTDFKRFVRSIANDMRIPNKDKKTLLIMIVLIVSPIDIIPDWIRFFGLADDFIFLSIVLDYFFSVLDSQILLSHYPWGMKSFARIRAIARFTKAFVPNFISKKIWQYVGDPY